MFEKTIRGEKVVIAICVVEMILQLYDLIFGLVNELTDLFAIVPFLMYATLMVALYFGSVSVKYAYIVLSAGSIIFYIFLLVYVFRAARAIPLIPVLIIAARFVMITLLLADSSVRKFLASQRGEPNE